MFIGTLRYGLFSRFSEVIVVTKHSAIVVQPLFPLLD
jgi:hypothetical protein